MSFASDVRRGFAARPRWLPPTWFYDDLGSALFETICELPWYRVTRAELALIDRAAPELARLLSDVRHVVELGPGDGEKLDLLLSRVLDKGRRLSVTLVDVSPAALALAKERIGAHPGVRVETLANTYAAGLLRLSHESKRAGRTIVLFMGSNIGNFEPAETGRFLRLVRRALQPEDLLLVGTDLVKPPHDLMLAYDDPLGVTAAFNKNLLLRMNKELGANFQLHTFDHRAVWNEEKERVEMYLVSKKAQVVGIPGAKTTARFRAGEAIFTEASHKYREDGLERLFVPARFAIGKTWVDTSARFALSLLRAV